MAGSAHRRKHSSGKNEPNFRHLSDESRDRLIGPSQKTFKWPRKRLARKGSPVPTLWPTFPGKAAFEKLERGSWEPFPAGTGRAHSVLVLHPASNSALFSSQRAAS